VRARADRRAAPRAVPGDVVRAILVPVLTMALAGVVGGAVWAWWADPPRASDAASVDVELLLGRQFAVDGRYAITGVLLGLAVGGVLAWVLRHSGWLLVVGVGVGGGLAALESYALGLWWGPEPSDGAERGALLSGGIAVHVPGVFLSWPIGALLGLLLVVWLADRAGDLVAEPVHSELPGRGSR
jgi:hypothetical protein